MQKDECPSTAHCPEYALSKPQVGAIEVRPIPLSGEEPASLPI